MTVVGFNKFTPLFPIYKLINPVSDYFFCLKLLLFLFLWFLFLLIYFFDYFSLHMFKIKLQIKTLLSPLFKMNRHTSGHNSTGKQWILTIRLYALADQTQPRRHWHIPTVCSTTCTIRRLQGRKKTCGI